MKKIFALIAVVLVALTLVACSKDSSATGYGLVHGHYVAVVDMTVDSKGVVKDVKIDEYYLAYNAAQVVAPAEGATPHADIAQVGANWFAKYFYVDGIIFTIVSTNVEEVTTYERNWTNATHGNLEAWVINEANAKKYVEAVEAGKVYISNAAGQKLTGVTVTGNAATGWLKSTTGYGGTRWDWAAAMEGIEEILKGTKMNLTFSLNDPIKVDGEDVRYWTVDGVTTGATLVDFADYVNVAKRAYETATK